MSCVIDGNPLFGEQVLRWFACLHVLAGVAPDDLLICAADGVRPPVLEYLAGVGVGVVDVPAFDARSHHCNKVNGMRTLARLAAQGAAVLSDCDVAFLRDPRTCVAQTGAIAAKTVDGPNPPLHILKEIFDVAGLPHPARCALELFPDAQTFAGYCNGGLYIADTSVFGRLVHPWDRWARWLLDRREMLRDWPVYVDQVAMLLALVESGVAVHPITARWNCPTHLRCALPLEEVYALHYHSAVDASGHLRTTGNPAVDAAVRRVNGVFDDVRRDAGVVRCG